MSTSQNITLAVAIVGAATGPLGAVPGITNTWHQTSLRKARLKATPQMAYRDGHGSMEIWEEPPYQCPKPALTHLCIEVVNLSAFDGIILEVGFGNPKTGYRRVPVMKAARIKPHDYHRECDSPGLRLSPEYISKPVAYAKTACGEVFLGTSPILKHHLEQVRREAKNG